MSTGDYNSLLTDIPAWIGNSADELLAVVPSCIQSALDRIHRDLDLHCFETELRGMLVVGAVTIPIPDDLLMPRFMAILTPYVNAAGAASTRRTMLPMKESEYLYQYCPDDSLLMQPAYYAIENAATYRLSPTPDQAYPYILGYKRRLPDLSVLAPQNWLTQHAYDIVLAAALAEAARFLVDDRQANLIATWEAKYNGLARGIQSLESRKERDDFRIPGPAPAQQMQGIPAQQGGV